jgi:hypothetical protein
LDSVVSHRPVIQWPVIEDQDLDPQAGFDEFRLACKCYGRGRGIHPMEMIYMLGMTLRGSRYTLYDILRKRYLKNGRLPGDAATVFDEIEAACCSTIKETPSQKKIRVEQDFNELSMGARPYCEFHIQWLKTLWNMEDVGVEIPGPDALYRKYLAKLPRDLCQEALRRSYQWSTGDTQTVRTAKTWEELKQVCEIVLSERVDGREIEKAGDSGYAFNPPNQGGGGLTATTPGGCRYCQRPGHTKALCPTAAAERRNETENLTAESYRTGAVCTMCAAVGVEAREHRAKHHDLAAQDVYKPGGAAPQQPRARIGDARPGGGNSVRPPPPPPPPIPPLPQRERRPTGGDQGGGRRASTPFAPRPPMAAATACS